jgi:hypothetical protein
MLRCQETGKMLVKPPREILTGQHYKTCRKKLKYLCDYKQPFIKKLLNGYRLEGSFKLTFPY